MKKRKKEKSFSNFEKRLSSGLQIKQATGNMAFEKVSILIHGYKKIGKTALLAQFNKPLFLTFDPPNESLVYDYIYMDSWSKFVKSVNEITGNPQKYDYNYVVIDNIEKAYDLCMSAFLKKHNAETPNHVASHGGGHRMVKKLYEAPLTKLLNSKFVMLATGHTVYKQITTPEGDDFHIVTCDGSKYVLDFFEKYLSTIMCFCYISKSKKALRLRGGTGYNVDTHIDGKFKYTDGSKITVIPMGDSKEEGFKNLKLAFDNKLKKPKIRKSLVDKMRG